MKRGYDVFGKAYGIMLRNDPHAPLSIDHKLMQNMILLDDKSARTLYLPPKKNLNLYEHELYDFAQKFKGINQKETINNLLHFLKNQANAFTVPFSEMKFGGTEKEILIRGTDWCSDLSRVGVTLLQCLELPARLVYLTDINLAYHGHTVVEVFYEGKYGVLDFLHGYSFYGKDPLNAWDLLKNPTFLEGYPSDYVGLYTQVAISEYSPLENHNYAISFPNEYTIRLMETNHQGRWFMGEDDKK
ncbi:MAG: hypothetical protein ACOX3K_02535 [Bacilli bacterium]